MVSQGPGSGSHLLRDGPLQPVDPEGAGLEADPVHGTPGRGQPGRTNKLKRRTCGSCLYVKIGLSKTKLFLTVVTNKLIRRTCASCSYVKIG